MMMIEDHTRNLKLTWRLTMNTLLTMLKLADNLTRKKKYIELSSQLTKFEIYIAGIRRSVVLVKTVQLPDRKYVKQRQHRLVFLIVRYI